MKYKAVIFDLDGTLIDSMGIWLDVDKEYLIKRNIPVPEDLFEDVPEGNSFNEICQYFKDKFNLPDSIDEIGAEWTEMVEQHYKADIILKSGALELLKKLQAGNVKMAIGTSNSRYLAETVLKANKVLHYFESIVAGCDEIKGKPFPDIFLKAAEELEVDPQDCLVIEDTLHGVRAAHNGGMGAIAMYDAHASHDVAAAKAAAEYYCHNYYELIELFSQIL